MIKKINMGIIIYGHHSQKKINEDQFNDLKKLLGSFKLKKYYFNKNGKKEILKDFKNRKIDIILKNSYGRGNENNIEKFLEKYNIPFLGSDSKTTLIGTSKILSKKVFKKNNLPIAKDFIINKEILKKSLNNILSNIKDNIGYPFIFKDTVGTDSRDIYFINNIDECKIIFNKIIKDDKTYIAEEYIKNNYEITCFVVGNTNPKVYEPVGIIKNKEIISNLEKNKVSIKLEVPANLPISTINKIKNISKKAHIALKCKTFSRADILVKNNKLYLLEVDVHPGFRLKSATVVSAKYKGETANDLFLKFYKIINK